MTDNGRSDKVPDRGQLRAWSTRTSLFPKLEQHRIVLPTPRSLHSARLALCYYPASGALNLGSPGGSTPFSPL